MSLDNPNISQRNYYHQTNLGFKGQLPMESSFLLKIQLQGLGAGFWYFIIIIDSSR